MLLQRHSTCFTLLFLIAILGPQSGAQTTAADSAGAQDPSLVDTVKLLQEQVKELRSVVENLRTESERYRVETRELREELHSAVAQLPSPAKAVPVEIAAQDDTAQSATTADILSGESQSSDAQSRLAKLEERYELLTGQIVDQYQTKVESRSKYKIRLSGLVLFDLFSNRGAVFNADIPGQVDGPDSWGRANSTGFSLRQSQIGLEVFGPEIAGAKTRGDVQADFAGGFPNTPNGVTLGLFRLRTGTIHFDWQHTSVVAGQDAPFFSAMSPTSFASLAEPALAYAGNLWTWTPQVRIEHRLAISENSNLILQGGILDGLTGEPPTYSYGRVPQAGEYSRQPAYAGRVAWSHDLFGQPFILGAGGYYSRQNWGFGRNLSAWASTVDWSIPFTKWLGLNGEFYRGQGLGGLGGGSYQSALFSGSPGDPTSRAQGLEAIGGWTQLKFRASSKLEFNAAAGQDNPFANEIREYPFSAYRGGAAVPAARNQTGLLNFIFRPRSDLVLSAEYGHIATFQIDNNKYTADRVSLIMGIMF
jgi:hypothetical protein